MAAGALPGGVAVLGAMPALSAVLGNRGAVTAPADAAIAALRLTLDETAGPALADALAQTGPDLQRILVACVPVDMAPGSVVADPARLAPLVRHLQDAGWDIRTDRMRLPECALTGCTLIEARRPTRNDTRP